ncbi:MAG: amidase [Burkholderiales bacterium]
MTTSTVSDLWRLDAVELAALVRTGRASAREVTASALARLQAVNPAATAVPRALDEEALAAAAAIDAARARGEALGPLAGVPVTTKINVDQRGLPTDNGVPALKALVATTDSPVVAALREAGAVIVGRTNSPAFAMRGHTDNALHGATVNPWNRGATPGGSSGGAGAATASGIGTIAHGNDIGGSIRWPAYCNGVVGLRPGYGRVARVNDTMPAGRPMSSQIMAVDGPLARSVRDVRLGFEVMAARPDARDNRWTPVPLRLPPPRRPIRVALVTKVDGAPHVAESCWNAVRTAGRYLEAAGYAVEEAAPPDMHRANTLWNEIATTEQAAMLGPRLAQSGDPGIAEFLGHWWTLRPPADLRGYMNAFVERDDLLRRWQLFLEHHPIVVMPASVERPVPAGIDVQGLEGARRMIDAIYFQLMLPTLGLPGLAVPVGMDGDLPMGVQVFGARWREDLLLDAGEVIEAHEGVRRPIDPR